MTDIIIAEYDLGSNPGELLFLGTYGKTLAGTYVAITSDLAMEYIVFGYNVDTLASHITYQGAGSWVSGGEPADVLEGKPLQFTANDLGSTYSVGTIDRCAMYYLDTDIPGGSWVEYGGTTYTPVNTLPDIAPYLATTLEGGKYEIEGIIFL